MTVTTHPTDGTGKRSGDTLPRRPGSALSSATEDFVALLTFSVDPSPPVIISSDGGSDKHLQQVECATRFGQAGIVSLVSSSGHGSGTRSDGGGKRLPVRSLGCTRQCTALTDSLGPLCCILPLQGGAVFMGSPVMYLLLLTQLT